MGSHAGDSYIPLVDRFVSWAGCPVFDLRLEGTEAGCAKPFPRVHQEERGHTPLGCVEGEDIGQPPLPVQFPKTCFICWGCLYISVGEKN